MKPKLFCLGLLFCTVWPAAHSAAVTENDSCAGLYRIGFYNVENYFHPAHDTLKNDYDFTPGGMKGWSYAKFTAKRNRIFKVISAINAETPLLAIGLAEVENNRVLRELCYGTPLRYLGFDFVHFESPDPRGVDVALLYRREFLEVDTAYPIAMVFAPDTVARTRDILYVRGWVKGTGMQQEDRATILNGPGGPFSDKRAGRPVLQDADREGRTTIHLFVNHFPSKYGGATATAGKRTAAARLLRSYMDSIYMRDTTALVIAMGDLNTGVDDGALAPLNEKPWVNLMAQKEWQNDRKGAAAGGSHKFRETWTTIDHIIVSLHTADTRTAGRRARLFDREFLLMPDEKYMGVKPFRTFYGATYLGGYSDHLPVYIEVCF